MFQFKDAEKVEEEEEGEAEDNTVVEIEGGGAGCGDGVKSHGPMAPSETLPQNPAVFPEGQREGLGLPVPKQSHLRGLRHLCKQNSTSQMLQVTRTSFLYST